jgi:hypothetical protein
MTDTRGDDVVGFCRRMYPRLVGSLALQCGDAELAKEVAQEALTRAWQRWARVSRNDSPEAWVFRVAFNLSTSRFRRATREKRAFAQVASLPPVRDADETDRIAIRAAVAGLPPRQRTALVLATASPLQVGVGSVRPPSGYRLQASHYDTASDAVDIRLSGPNDVVCSVTSKYTGVASPNFGSLVPESLENDGAQRTWHRSPQGAEWGTAPTTSDSFVIECTDPSAARALAASASFKNGS